jgi:hypothetical protein
MFILDPGFLSTPDPNPEIQTALDPRICNTGNTPGVSLHKKMACNIFLSRLWSRQWSRRGDEQRASGGESRTIWRGWRRRGSERGQSVISTTFLIFIYRFLHAICELARLCSLRKFRAKSWFNYFCCFLILYREAKGRFFSSLFLNLVLSDITNSHGLKHFQKTFS